MLYEMKKLKMPAIKTFTDLDVKMLEIARIQEKEKLKKGYKYVKETINGIFSYVLKKID